MKLWRLITGVILVLVLGMLIGGAGTHYYLRHKYRLISLDRKDRTAHLLKTFSRKLDLSQDQKAAVEKILQRMAERLTTISFRGGRRQSGSSTRAFQRYGSS